MNGAITACRRGRAAPRQPQKAPRDRSGKTAALALACLLSALTGLSATPAAFRLSTSVDGALAGTGLLLGAGAFAYERSVGQPLPPSGILDPGSVNPLDRPFMAPFSATLDPISTAFTLTALAAPAVLLSAPSDDWFPLGVMYAESMLLTWGVKELGKNLLPRYRPYMYYSGYPEAELSNGDYRQSFPSGHTALAFTAAGFTACAFSLYYADSPWKVPAIAGSYALASAVAALRVASGNHFVTDVLAGAALGTLSGWLVPALHATAFALPGLGASRAGVSGNASPGEGNTRAGTLSFAVLPTGVSFTLRL
ncbi:phosphatase PAP2 family protein [Gracilinema caldarium]|uniref:Phosphoesterase PA-phosphatase related protein n=1 Tax=Gracilinema caldarium (strain ATCC 51460 / DSM 7334 / H1) TaxID=744872 RepID=F8F1K4_GRAC1|nr:phosphatase PAP2 family protein [Gracilinema caldarium]AEJ19057.1 phosphoesterase PA-phosphatase related protein [Gracilinema caldarium DSM 7334]